MSLHDRSTDLPSMLPKPTLSASYVIWLLPVTSNKIRFFYMDGCTIKQRLASRIIHGVAL